MGVTDTGFTQLWERRVSCLDLGFSAYRHACGLEVICVSCADVENVFVAGFPTAGWDDRGVQHVVEHVVMGGSRHYRVKGPCDELSRGSLATYINAETYLDRTLYPYASLNAFDFRSGVEVYLDGVFNPLLRRETFMQEGWRYEFAEAGSGGSHLRTTGIVLNERRAQLNDMSDVALGAAYRELLPGHPLSFDSGGLPGVIETLTYEDFTAYYRSHYAPGQARLFFYGNLPTEEKLSWVDTYLARHCADRLAPVSSGDADRVPAIAPWTAPRTAEVSLSLDGSEEGEGDSGWSLNWHLGQLLGRGERLGMELLYMLLLEDDSSPLRKAMLDSGLCDDLMDCTGLETEHAECLFVVGAVNCRPQDFGALREVCLGCLAKLASRGFRQVQVRSAFNQLSLRYREVPNGYGLQVGRTVMRNWLSGQDPLLGLDYEEEFQELEALLSADQEFLRKLLCRYLVDNVHRVEIHLRPDAEAWARRREAEERRLDRVYAEMSATQRASLSAALESWRAYQAAGDSPEALASFPHLRRSDLPRKPFDPEVDREVLKNGSVLLRGLVRSEGVNYVKLGYDLGIFTSAELEFLPVFACLLDSVGVRGMRYGSFEERLGRAGAEMDLDVQLESMGGQGDGVRGLLTVKLGGLGRCWSDSLDCLDRRCHESVFTERSRLRDVLRQCWSQAGQKLYSDDDAMDYVGSRSAAGVSRRDTVYEGWYGVEGVKRLRRALSMLKGRGTELTDLLSGMMGKLSSAAPQVVSYVGDDGGLSGVRQWLETGPSVLGGLTSLVWDPGDLSSALGRREWLPLTRHEGCCVRSLRACTYGDPLWAGLSVYCELLSEGYLLDSIRVSGGAYGGGCSYYPGCGLVQLYSYSDPQPGETFRVFGRGVGHLESWSESQITGAIIGCIRGDVPLHASECCNCVFSREVLGLSNAERRSRREALLGVTLREVRQAAEALTHYLSSGFNDCVAGDSTCCAGGDFASVGWGRR